jgi:putative cardiolipin synthase
LHLRFRLAAALCASLLSACASIGPEAARNQPKESELLELARTSSVFDVSGGFLGSPFDDVGTTGLFPVRTPDQCEVAVLASGEDSFPVRLAALKAARRSIRIQALVFKGDESGLRVAEILKQKKAEGLDVRVIVDAFSNPWLQAQWMLFDLKQHGIEVEGYEALALQWINELPIPLLTPHFDPDAPNKRHHEKVWIVDGETPEGMAVTGGLNIGNEYFRADPDHPEGNWRDQDVVVRGKVLADMVAMFDRNFQKFVAVKKSRGPLNTNAYWDATRAVMDHTGTLPIKFKTDPRLIANVAGLEAREPVLAFHPSTCRFLQNRPQLRETYIQQAYLKLIEGAQEELLVANAYFVPTPTITQALHDAARRCVAVTLLSNSPETNDLPEISMVGRGHYRTLLSVNESPEVGACARPDAGIRIWEWTGQAPDDPAPTQGTMHSKFAIVDRQVSLVGSYNLDPRSENLNSESALVFENATLAQALAQSMLESDLRFSRRVTPKLASQFENPKDVLYRLRSRIGHFFEGEL